MNTQKQRKGRSFLGTLFLVAIGFAMGFYNVEILSAADDFWHGIHGPKHK
jgi:hypothetical protein